jgi:adenosine kinase
VNEYEYQLLQKHTGLRPEAILGLVKFLVVTRGAEGSDIYAEGKLHHVPVVQVDQIVDPTGVGDAFRGGFLRGYQLGFEWTLCGQMGALSAAFCLEQQGTQAHAYSLQEYISRFRNSFDDSGKLNQLI